LAQGGLIRLKGSGVVAFTYCPISDSGVRIIRLDADRGEKIWEAYCNPLGVTHSAYRHAADVVLRDNRIVVTSRGQDTFVEVLDANTGRQMSRTIEGDAKSK
jgi:outer membrane protein assembly factor BamB